MAIPAQLSIRFVGLAGLVPPRTGGDPWLSVLPNLRGGWQAGTKGIPYDIPPHQALFVVREKDVVDTEVPVKLRAELSAPALGGLLPAGEKLLFFEPLQEAIRLECDDPALRVSDDVPAQYGSAPARVGEETSLCWIPPLARVSPRARFDRSMLTGDNQNRVVVPADSRLAATFVLDAGELRATDVIRTVQGAPAIYEFRRPHAANAGETWKQSLATGYELRLVQPEDNFVFVFEDPAGTKRRIELASQQAQAWILNRELEEVLGFTQVHEAVGNPGGDRDFACFYALTEGWAAGDAGALSIPFEATAGGGGWSRPCGAARFEA